MKTLTERTAWVDNLRSFITILVVAHHSTLAYTTFAAFNKERYISSTHPIVDAARWIGLDIFVNFNDIFFMSLMFLIGGLFIMKSISKKGPGVFIRERIYRLFIPFMIGCTLLMMLAYYPAYILAGHQHDVPAFIVDYFTIQSWPVGPPWFIWVLFLFNILVPLYYRSFERKAVRIEAFLSRLKDRPVAAFFLLFGITFSLYVPVAMSAGPQTWTGIGPFDFQVSRFLLYLAYFNVGVYIGATNFNTNIFLPGGALVRHWKGWLVAMLLCFTAVTLVPDPLRRLVAEQKIPALLGWSIYFLLYAASCTLSCIALAATFRARYNDAGPIRVSLSDNAYSIYLLHYIFLTWCQYCLLDVQLHAVIKFLITFTVALGGSWLVGSMLRRIPLVRRYV
jgi:glucans biosynthesis protein C